MLQIRKTLNEMGTTNNNLRLEKIYIVEIKK